MHRAGYHYLLAGIVSNIGAYNFLIPLFSRQLNLSKGLILTMHVFCGVQ